MTYRVEYKTSPTGSWTGYGGNYPETQAYSALERARKRGCMARMVSDNGRGNVVAFL